MKTETISSTTYTTGSLVRARGREWVVLPESDEEWLLLRPLGGMQDEVTGIHTGLEGVEPATFDLPDPSHIGDYRSGRLLRDAIRLGFRSSAGPFRSFARIAVEPRPYQLVPLLMALKLDPVRLLIADDVGIGKTIEACLVARELLDRGEIGRLAVLCPPQLAEQWQNELISKFFIDAELVLPSTATRLERGCRMGESLFERYPFVVVSTDFIKSDRRRDEFLRTCPEFVIVDEAHTCAPAMDRRGGRHQRYELVSGLAQDPHRHLVLVTATPHSGKEEAFRSLLGILNPQFEALPDQLAGSENQPYRRRLAQYFVQRRRADIRTYLDADTPFPQRETAEATYTLTDDYRRLFGRVLDYAREMVRTDEGPGYRQRVRWWSALALLRSLASSPAAAAASLRSRAATIDAETEEAADDIGQRMVLDLLEDEAAEGIDVTPGCDISELEADEDRNRRRLLEMARASEALQGDGDAKLQTMIGIVKETVRDGYNPIIFCRFIATVNYLTDQLREALRGIEVMGVTGELPPAEREQRVHQLVKAEKRVLVCTDCLSEGINLQEGFDAVIHYDLSWNPTRHEQREGRADRYGQPSDTVRTLIYYGIDNKIDGIVLDVLLRKHQTIRSSLGISVPVPADTAQVVEAIFEGLLLREDAQFSQTTLPGLETYVRPVKEELFREWDAASEREKRSRTMFAQRTIKVEEVARELQAAREAVGSGVDVAQFLMDAAQMFGGFVSPNAAVRFDLAEVPRALKESIGNVTEFSARFELPIKEGQIHLTRTHPIVEGMATYVMDTALDPEATADERSERSERRARRGGALRTSKVKQRTTLLLMRFRYHIIKHEPGQEPTQLLAEDSQVMAFEGPPGEHTWIDTVRAEELLLAAPDANIHPQQASQFVGRVVDSFDALRPDINAHAEQRGQQLLEAHQRVRAASRQRGVRYEVQAQLPPDVLGIYVYLPTGGGQPSSPTLLPEGEGSQE